MKDIDDGEKILAGRAEGDVFGLHRGEGDEAVKMAPPLDRAVGQGNDVS